MKPNIAHFRKSDMEKIRKIAVTFLMAAMIPFMAFCSDNQEPNSATQQSSTMKIKLTVKGQSLYATLEDNATTRALAAKLPLTLPMMDLYGREMCYRFPDALPTDDARTQGYEVGEIVYYPPMHSLVIMYAQNGERFQMQKLGHIDGDVSIFNNIGDVDVTWSMESSGVTEISDENNYSVHVSTNTVIVNGGKDIRVRLYDLNGRTLDLSHGDDTVCLNTKGYRGIAFVDAKCDNGHKLNKKIVIR